MSITEIFTLWSAACLLGLKYKLTAHKIHIAVKEQNVVNRLVYREIFVSYAAIYSLAVIYYIWQMVCMPGVIRKKWP